MGRRRSNAHDPVVRVRVRVLITVLKEQQVVRGCILYRRRLHIVSE